jgi:L-fuconolactonase
MIIDSHTHIWPRWPYQPPVPDPGSRGSFENLLFEMDNSGVDQAVLINARIQLSDDNNDYGAQAVAAFPDRFFHVVDVDSRWGADYHRPGAADRLRLLVDRYHPDGLSHYLGPENDGWLASPEAKAFFAVAAEHRLVVSLAAPPFWLADLRQLARAFPETAFMVNHLGVPLMQPGDGRAALGLELDHEDLPNLLVKVSGYYYGHPRPWDYPYPGPMEIVRAFYEHWGPKRMVWASDFPSVLRHMSYRQSLEVLREHAPFIAPADLDAILGGTLQSFLPQRSASP